jgi:hypothetical protein
MIGDDLKLLQDQLLEGGKQILRERGHLGTVGFVVTLHKHVEKLLESGWGAEFIGDPKDAFVRLDDDRVVALVLDMTMDWKRLYHAVLDLYPKMQKILPALIEAAAQARVDDPYKRVVRPFLKAAQLDEKDIVAGTMRQVCEKVDAFACIMQCEAWLYEADPSVPGDQLPDDLSTDAKSIEVIFSSMETHDFARLRKAQIQRASSTDPKTRDEGAVIGFGESIEMLITPEEQIDVGGRFTNFLKPLELAS